MNLNQTVNGEQDVRHLISNMRRRVWALTLMGAMLLFGTPSSTAQDIGAVKARLNDAVQAGEITEKQADVMLFALLDFLKTKDVDLDELGAKLKAAVSAGKLTEAEAMAKWEAAARNASKTKGDAEKAKGAKGKSLNRLCPVSGEQVGDDPPTSESRGRMVAFCCENCKAEFDADPRAFAKELKQRARRKAGLDSFLPVDPDAFMDEGGAGGLTTPPMAATREGSAQTLVFGWAANATHRFIDASHQGAPRLIHGVSFRLDQREHDALGRTWENVTLRVAHGDWSSIGYNDSKEYRLVDAPTKVFDQEWSFPAVKGKPPLTPASWGGIQNSLTFRFSEPFAYNGEDAIFLEFVFRGGKAHDGRGVGGADSEGLRVLPRLDARAWGLAAPGRWPRDVARDPRSRGACQYGDLLRGRQ